MLPRSFYSLRISTLQREVPTRLQSTYKLSSRYNLIREHNFGQEIMILLEAWIDQPKIRKLEVVTFLQQACHLAVFSSF